MTIRDGDGYGYSLVIATSMALKSMPTERDNFICPYRGPISYGTLRIDDATAAVEKATQLCNERRKRRVPLTASLAEIDLLAALWFYGEKPELQHPVGRYDLDFYFPDYRAAIEVDGAGYHLVRDDERRDIYVLKNGIVTVRISGKRVYRDPLWSARYACKTIVDYRRDHPLPKDRD